ncbi:MAG: hypothetical protein LBT79_04575 [Elusimicrobiota bacterium]|jgi:drug/metabolite transporter (DMT)-like permease|nr:hypothetical protein [Elusimicrobiota bacterium]
MSLYTIKKFQFGSILKVCSVVLIVFSLITVALYTAFIKYQVKEAMSTKDIAFITAGITVIYLIIALIAILLIVFLYNALAPKIGGVVVELDSKEE